MICSNWFPKWQCRPNEIKPLERCLGQWNAIQEWVGATSFLLPNYFLGENTISSKFFPDSLWPLLNDFQYGLAPWQILFLGRWPSPPHRIGQPAAYKTQAGKGKIFSGTTKTQIGAKLLTDNQCKKKKSTKVSSIKATQKIWLKSSETLWLMTAMWH